MICGYCSKQFLSGIVWFFVVRNAVIFLKAPSKLQASFFASCCSMWKSHFGYVLSEGLPLVTARQMNIYMLQSVTFSC